MNARNQDIPAASPQGGSGTSARGCCLCGAVQFEVTGGFDAFFLCHCSRCRKDSGSSHAANLFAARARLTWRSGAPEVTRFDLPGTRHAKSFCRICGSALPFEQAGGVVVPAGALDTQPGVAPQAHICHADRAGWADALADLPRLDGLPG